MSCAPSGTVAGRPMSRSSTAGGRLTSTCPPRTACSPAPSLNVTSPDGSMPTISAPVLISAPARLAAASSAPETAPMPPTGTFHSPVPSPITW
ncbi:hypothetical protein [Nonomuraea salmonea]|uniref:hypothetical protein n=1 Tax=Nonomuraea salmonea TaxID=46181 RepID=UPI0031E4E921